MGILLIYTNEKKSGKVLEEELKFEGTKGLKILGQKDQTKVDIKLSPGETQEIWLQSTSEEGEGWNYRSNSSYKVIDF